MAFNSRAREGGALLLPGLAVASLVLLGALLFLPKIISAGGRTASQPQGQAASVGRPILDFSGTVAARDGGRLRFKTDLGSVVIHTHDTPSVDYRVHLEAEPSTKNAARLLRNFALQAQPTDDGVMIRGTTNAPALAGRLWVTIEIDVPRNYSLDLTTAVGNITTDDLGGRQMLLTQGGNITTGNINGSARLTAVAGGHITVKNVTGELIADTGGGHITTGTIGGDATLHTHGGHIRSDSIGGIAHLSTDGGNIALEHAGADLIAETAGGQIQIGEAAGLIRAKTDGGGIRVVRSSGPANLTAADGSIYLTKADAAVKASSATGGITAWIMSPSKDSGDCELESTNGDIVVHLSRKVPVTIDAQVQMGQSHGFEIDPLLPIAVRYDESGRGERVAHASGVLNGGGEVIRVRNVSGNVHFVLSEVDEQMSMYRQQMEGLQKQLQDLQKSVFPQSR